jgi:hypothetical protein
MHLLERFILLVAATSVYALPTPHLGGEDLAETAKYLNKRVTLSLSLFLTEVRRSKTFSSNAQLRLVMVISFVTGSKLKIREARRSPIPPSKLAWWVTRPSLRLKMET